MSSPISPVDLAESTPRRRWMLPKNAWQIVASREIYTKLSDKAFIGGTIVTLVLLLGGLGVGAWLSNRATDVQVAVVGQAQTPVVSVIDTTMKASNAKNQAAALVVSTDEQAKAAVASGEADLALLKGSTGWELVFDKDANDTVRAAVSQSIQSIALQQAGAAAQMSPEQVRALTALKVTLLNGDSQRADLARVSSFIFALMFFLSALGFGMAIAQSVVEEKASRVVEILASAIPLRQLLAGKVLGNTALAFGQMAIYAILASVGLALSPMTTLLPQLQAPMAWFLVFFLAGFLALACVWAVAGSLASRVEDLSSSTTPLTSGLMLVYVIGFTATGTFKQVMSYVPVASSVLMPARLVAGEASWWEPVVALLLNIAFAALTVVVGEKIYRRSLLQTSGRISFRQALKLTD